MAKGKPKDGSKNPGGRPIKWTSKALVDVGEDLIKWMNAKPENLFFQEYLNGIGLYANFLSDYQGECKGFSQLVKNARDIQEQKLWKYGVANKLNPALTIFALKNNHGATDKVENKTEFSGELEVKKRLLDD